MPETMDMYSTAAGTLHTSLTQTINGNNQNTHVFSCVMQGGRDPAPTDRSRGHEPFEGEGQKQVGQTTLTGAERAASAAVPLVKKTWIIPSPSMRIMS